MTCQTLRQNTLWSVTNSSSSRRGSDLLKFSGKFLLKKVAIKMNRISKCVIVGRGSLGMLYYAALSAMEDVDVSFAADRERVKRYESERISFCGRELSGVRYFTPKKGDEAVDLVLITTKWGGFRDALELISPIVTSSTVVVPLLNGLLPYEVAVQRYGDTLRVLRAFYIGTTASRQGASVSQSGDYTTVMEGCEAVESLFERCGIAYRVEEDMVRAQWQKYVINIGLNQCSVISGGVSYGEIKRSESLRGVVAQLMREAEAVAVAEGISGARGMADYGIGFLDSLTDSDYSSMAQDLLSGRAMEVEIFAGDLVNRAKSLGVDTPCNLEFLGRK